MKSLKVIVIELSSARGLENAQKIVIDGGGGNCSVLKSVTFGGWIRTPSLCGARIS